MNRRRDIDVVVVGAGVAGSAMALALVRDGFEVALVEARPPPHWQAGDEVDARVVALAADAVALFEDLDIWQQVTAARACPYRRMQVWDALAPGSLSFDAADRGDAALGWIVENRLLQHVLWESLQAAAAGSANVRLICPAQVVDVSNEETGVSVGLADGQRVRARLLVAADGAASPIRQQLGIATRDRDYAQRAIVCHVGTERAHESTAWQRFQPGGPLAFLPLLDGRCSIVWSQPVDEANRRLQLDDQAFCAELGCALDFRLGRILSATPRFAFPLQLRLAARYHAGRSVLLGDAAHVVHPLAGQGLNLGLRDVGCLRSVVSAARQRGNDPGAPASLRRYARERRSENALAARGLDLIERGFASASMPVAGLRGLALGLADRSPNLKRWFGDAAAGRF
jgi:2-octaprenyl-3-methyl-6-methoxy-1,4-benzoquinol hydroxylase/2-octaprenylphenol hydroxylase